MALPPPAIVQVSSSWVGTMTPAYKKKRTTIRPVCVGTVLVVMYVVFAILVTLTLEDGRIVDTGAAYHSIKSVAHDMTTKSKRPGSAGNEADRIDDPELARDETNKKPGSAAINSELVHFCGECRWKDTLYNCDARVAYEVEHQKSTEIEAKKRNLLYCTRPYEQHVSDLAAINENSELVHFCGECRWKDTLYDCDARVAYEVEHQKLTEIEAKKRNLLSCMRPDEQHVSDLAAINENSELVHFCGECRWKDTLYNCDARVAYEVEHQKLTEIEAKKRNLLYCTRSNEQVVLNLAANNENSELVHFCGECQWKDTLYDCDDRVAYEVEHHKSTEIEAKKRNLLYCTRPSKQHVSDLAAINENSELVHFCGECRWKDTLYDCNTRVAYEVEHQKSTEIEAKKRNLLYCTRRNNQHVSDFCGECLWKDTEFDCNKRVAWEVKHKKIPRLEAQRRNLPLCRRPP